jgi:3-hydroxyisobutyrate dehydrogenase-like beta-hydroxyacid dehydrogenase
MADAGTVMGHLGFVGLGMMGLPMVRNLARHGRPIVVHDLDPEAMRSACMSPGVTSAATPADCAAGADVVFTCLPSPAAIESVSLGERGLLAAASPGLLACELSTTTPELSVEMAARWASRGGRYIESAMIGPPSAAEAAELFFVVAGPADDAARVAPMLATMGRGSRHVGGVGDAMRTKLLHNALGMIHTIATCEVLGLCERAGVDAQAFVDVVEEAGRSRGIGWSMFFHLHARDIASGRERNAARLHIAAKDAHLAHEFAQALGYDAPLIDEADRAFAAAMAAGFARHEFTAVARVVARRGAVASPERPVDD